MTTRKSTNIKLDEIISFGGTLTFLSKADAIKFIKQKNREIGSECYSPEELEDKYSKGFCMCRITLPEGRDFVEVTQYTTPRRFIHDTAHLVAEI